MPLNNWSHRFDQKRLQLSNRLSSKVHDGISTPLSKLWGNRSSQLTLDRESITLWFITFALLLFGLLMVYSASFIHAHDRSGDGFMFIRKQMIFATLGIATMWFVSRLHYRIWLRGSYLILAATMLLLILVYIPGLGVKVGGAQRWLAVAGFRFQPVEVAKFAIVLFVARQLYLKADRLHIFRAGVVGTLLMIMPAFMLILLQPDLGSVVVVTMVALGMMFLAGVPLGYLFGLVGSGIGVLTLLIVSSPYRLARFQTFLDPWSDPTGRGFQILQSYLGVSQGSFTGVGLGNGKGKLFFLPEAHNDFIVAVIGEELGFLGIAALVFGFGFLFFQGLRLTWQGYLKHQDQFGLIFGAGLVFLLGVQGLVNMGVVLGILPTKGLNLPLVSYGGSALLVNLFILGVVLSISRGNRNTILSASAQKASA